MLLHIDIHFVCCLNDHLLCFTSIMLYFLNGANNNYLILVKPPIVNTKKMKLSEILNLMEAMVSCVEKFFPNDIETKNEVVKVESLKYRNSDGILEK